MKKHFWLILAAVSLLGMIIMPGMAHSDMTRPGRNPKSAVGIGY